MLEILPIMPVLCSMLFNAHYAQNYAGIIGASLVITLNANNDDKINSILGSAFVTSGRS